MEKPSFESIGNSYTIGQFIDYGDLNEQAEQQIKEAHKAGCEHVWNTHVVPLQDQSSITIDRIESENDSYKRRYNQLESENKALREEINALNVDIQSYRNGHEANAKRYNDLLIERNKLKEEIERLKAELKNANSALDNISDMGHA